jgi:hypothetical protein
VLPLAVRDVLDVGVAHLVSRVAHQDVDPSEFRTVRVTMSRQWPGCEMSPEIASAFRPASATNRAVSSASLSSDR